MPRELESCVRQVRAKGKVKTGAGPGLGQRYCAGPLQHLFRIGVLIDGMVKQRKARSIQITAGNQVEFPGSFYRGNLMTGDMTETNDADIEHVC